LVAFPSGFALDGLDGGEACALQPRRLALKSAIIAAIRKFYRSKFAASDEPMTLNCDGFSLESARLLARRDLMEPRMTETLKSNGKAFE
jgi:hypothetical protein